MPIDTNYYCSFRWSCPQNRYYGGLNRHFQAKPSDERFTHAQISVSPVFSVICHRSRSVCSVCPVVYAVAYCCH